MNSPDSVKIIKRFYEAIDMLIASGVITGVMTFTKRYGINRWNFNTIRNTPESDMFQLAWLSYLIKDYGISSQWLMTGNGGMFGQSKYSFPIDDNRIKVKNYESYIEKYCEVLYMPTENQRRRVGTIKGIRYDKASGGPVLTIEISSGIVRGINLYTVYEINEL